MNNWVLHHDNAPAHTTLAVQHFLASKNMTVIPHPPLLTRFSPLLLLPLPQDENQVERMKI
jgi:hypothetical protein